MLDNLYKLFLDELAFFNNSSEVAHKELKSVKDCGGLAETAIRKLLQEVLGNRFKVTHGYVFSSAHQKLSPQVDIIIVDTLVPHTLKRFEYSNGLEIVPVESIVAIFEVKRTLSKDKIIEAADHLKKTIEFIPIIKDSPIRYLPGGIQLIKPIEGGLFSNPMIGILGLNHNESISDCKNLSEYMFLDIVYSFDGYLIGTQNPEKTNSFKALSRRNENDVVKYNALNFCNKKPQQLSKEEVLKMAIGFLICYLTDTSGRMLKMDDYFKISLIDK